MHEIGRGLIVLGLIFVAVGLALLFARHVPLLGRLPGDILVKRRSFTFYFPLVTGILLSALLSLLLYIIDKFR